VSILDSKFIVIIGITLIIAVIGILGYLGNNTNSIGPSSITSPTGIQIIVNYTGNWKGSINVGGSGQTLTSTGLQTFNETGRPTVVGCDIQKLDGSNKPLMVSIIENGIVLKSTTTTEPFGSVTASYSFIT
jgi:hypothetical protein